MRLWFCALVFSALSLTACGGGSHGTPCGGEGQACCASDACSGKLLCRSAVCVACPLDEAGVSWVAYTTSTASNLDISIVHEDGTCVVPLVTNAASDEFPVFQSTNSMGFSSTRSGGSSLYVHDLKTNVDTGLPTLGVAAFAPSFASNGIWIAFEGKATGATHSDIYRVLSVGGNPQELTSGTATSAGPVYSPDGNTIYFVSNRTDGLYRVYSMNADGTSQTVVTGTNGVLGRPAVSPDGTTLAFSKLDTSGTAEVLSVNLGTGTSTVVSDNGDSDPSFDASGTRLAVTSTRGGTPAIWLIDATDGANAAQVTIPPSGTVDGQPVFRP